MKRIAMRNAYLTLLCLFLLCGSLLSYSCTGDKVTAEEVRMIIGPYGGEILGPKGSKLVFPPEALEYEVPIILSVVPEDEIPANGGRERISSVLWMRPEGLTFKRPVTVELPYRSYQMTEASQLKQVTAFTSPRFYPDWKELAGTAETATHTFVFEIRHFSIAALYRLSEAEAECRCAWLGSWCADPENICAGISEISLQRSEEECSFSFDVYGENGESLMSESFETCPLPAEIETSSGGQNCALAYDGEKSAITLTCDDCTGELSQDFCN